MGFFKKVFKVVKKAAKVAIPAAIAYFAAPAIFGAPAAAATGAGAGAAGAGAAGAAGNIGMFNSFNMLTGAPLAGSAGAAALASTAAATPSLFGSIASTVKNVAPYVNIGSSLLSAATGVQASSDAQKAAQANEALIKQQGDEEARRLETQQKQLRGTLLARAGMAGADIGSGSVLAFLNEHLAEGKTELDWLKKKTALSAAAARKDGKRSSLLALGGSLGSLGDAARGAGGLL